MRTAFVAVAVIDRDDLPVQGRPLDNGAGRLDLR
jgi:hypothetical protein